jgi:uncharacterized protein YbgA (DUF1722 family)/uncharacterized protein YbbK (DUF523 family)
MRPTDRQELDKRSPQAADEVIRLGVSACLLGEQVRFDGGHKRDSFLTETLGRFVEWVPVCPEDEAGFGTPREAMRLVQGESGVRLLTVRSARDLTDQLRDYSSTRVAQLAALDLDGYVLKKDSPSCGLLRVKVYGGQGPAARSGRGIFADVLCAAFPLLPIEEEGRLCDPHLRENFVERVFGYRRVRSFFRQRVRAGDLVRFHTQHKLQLLAHSPAAYADLGRVVANTRGTIGARAAAEYSSAFMAALEAPATRGRHSNVLRHMTGYFRKIVDEGSRRDLAGAIDDYERGLIPLVVPVTLIAHYARRHEVQYLLDQVYLQPHPKELMLRNHV